MVRHLLYRVAYLAHPRRHHHRPIRLRGIVIIEYDANNVAHVNLEGKTEREYVLTAAKRRYLERHRFHVESYPPDFDLIKSETRNASKVMRQALDRSPAGPIQNQCIAYRNLCWLVLQAEKGRANQ